jgi:hypothetical protein
MELRKFTPENVKDAAKDAAFAGLILLIALGLANSNPMEGVDPSQVLIPPVPIPTETSNSKSLVPIKEGTPRKFVTPRISPLGTPATPTSR